MRACGMEEDEEGRTGEGELVPLRGGDRFADHCDVAVAVAGAVWTRGCAAGAHGGRAKKGFLCEEGGFVFFVRRRKSRSPANPHILSFASSCMPRCQVYAHGEMTYLKVSAVANSRFGGIYKLYSRSTSRRVLAWQCDFVRCPTWRMNELHRRFWSTSALNFQHYRRCNVSKYRNIACIGLITTVL